MRYALRTCSCPTTHSPISRNTASLTGPVFLAGAGYHATPPLHPIPDIPRPATIPAK